MSQNFLTGPFQDLALGAAGYIAKCIMRNQGPEIPALEWSWPSPSLTHSHHHFSFLSVLPLTLPVPPAYSSACSPALPRAGEAGPGSLPQAIARCPLSHPCAQWTGEGTELDVRMPPLMKTGRAGMGAQVPMSDAFEPIPGLIRLRSSLTSASSSVTSGRPPHSLRLGFLLCQVRITVTPTHRPVPRPKCVSPARVLFLTGCGALVSLSSPV